MTDVRPPSSLWLAAGAGLTGVLLGAGAIYLGSPAAPNPTPVPVAGSAPAPEPSPERPAPAEPTLAEAVAGTMDCVVNLESSAGLGAGVIVDPSGIVLTNYHVLAEALRPPPTLFGARLGAVPVLTARFANDRRVGATVLVADPEEDLAIVRLEPSPGEPAVFEAAAIGRSSELVVGQDVFAIGNPLGLRNTVSRGIVSALERTGILSDPQRAVLQLDASINVGNSGGPLFNLRGELVGIVVARPEQAQGIAFALPMDHVRGFLEALTAPEGARSGVIGLTLGSTQAKPGLSQAQGYGAGLVVGNVEPGGPADRAGVKLDDVIVALRGKRLDGLETTSVASLGAHLQKTVRGMFEGEVLSVTVVRNSEILDLQVEIAAASDRAQVGIDAEEQLGLSLDAKAEHPTVVTVLPATKLWGDPQALVGSKIRSVMGTPIGSYEDLAGRLSEVQRLRAHRGAAPRVLLVVERADGSPSAALLQLP